MINKINFLYLILKFEEDYSIEINLNKQKKSVVENQSNQIDKNYPIPMDLCDDSANVPNACENTVDEYLSVILDIFLCSWLKKLHKDNFSLIIPPTSVLPYKFNQGIVYNDSSILRDFIPIQDEFSQLTIFFTKFKV